MPRPHPELALVLSGGGARAAYQARFLRYLARQDPDLAPAILTGVSASAINAAYLAAHEGQFLEKVQHLCDLWTARIVPHGIGDFKTSSYCKYYCLPYP